MSRRLLLLMAVLLTGAGSSTAQATESPGSIVGLVRDVATGGPIVHASVFLLGSRFGTASDADGRFSIAGIPPGVYAVVVAHIGYVRVDPVEVTLEPGEVRRIAIDLRPAIATQTDPIVTTAPRIRVRIDEEGGPFAVSGDLESSIAYSRWMVHGVSSLGGSAGGGGWSPAVWVPPLTANLGIRGMRVMIER